MYDWKCISSVLYEHVCVISVGNITVGGTGKTPFVEYLIRSLSQNYRVAVLSRGYKRTTKGFKFVENNVTPCEVGDEPYQIKQKFPEIVVAVDADRVEGITKICEKYPDIQIVLLDDAFQYRKIQPNLSIVLADYHRPLYCDSVLPGGRLREWSCFAKRADVMVVTKSPVGITPEEQQSIERRYARIFPHDLLFTAIKYGEPLPIFPNDESLSTNDLKHYDILLVTGIANPKPLETYIHLLSATIHTMTFPDHHAFTEKDITNIYGRWNAIPSTNKILMTTEKDTVRLQQTKLPEAMAKRSYYVPVEMEFINDKKADFEQKLRVVLTGRS